MNNKPHNIDSSAPITVPITDVEASAEQATGLQAETGRYTYTGYATSLLISGPDRMEVNDPVGLSKTTWDGGSISVLIVHRVLQGQRTQARAIEALKAMGARGLKVQRDHQGKEHWKQDRVFEFGPSRSPRLGLQVVSAPADSAFWHAASRGNFRRRLTVHEAAKILRAAIREKEHQIRPFVSAKTILAIDIRHVGLLGTSKVAHAYNDLFGYGSYRLHSIWVVGPTLDHCSRFAAG